MPLDDLKAAHIQSLYSSNKIWAQRRKVVTLVYQSGSSFTYTAVSCIFRPQTILDLQIPDQAGADPRQQFDLLMVVPIGTNLTGVVYVADTTTATAPAVEAATKYAIVEALPVGMLPTGSRIVAKMRRLR